MSHIDNLEKTAGSLRDKKILDIGAGRGDFLLICAGRGYDAVGVEINDKKIADAQKNARERNLPLNIIKAEAEHLPFADNTFDFANMGEVIEHVRDPEQVLKELYRVLRPGGKAYVSVHNRFGIYDTHFHLWFLGWIPRSWADSYVSIFSRHKDYVSAIDVQNIKDMHYFTFRQFHNISSTVGFRITDIREGKINKKYGKIGIIILPTYKILLRLFYFNTFHLLLTKSDRN